MEDLARENTKIWEPLQGPQTEAFLTSADITFFGGAAGGTKTDLGIGLSLTTHTESIIFRKESTQLVGIIQRLTEILGSRDGYNGKDKIWQLPDRRIEFGSCPNPGDEQKYQGRPHSLKVFDEITHFAEAQFRFLCGWLRSTKEDEPQRILCTGNPPTDSDGEWVLKYWGPWLDSNHPHPAEPGELRWYTTVEGVDKEQPNGDPIKDNYGKWITPKSRTFIPSSVEDNPFLMETGYRDTLAALPEPLRSQMLEGDFSAGVGDDPWQAIPSSWVQAAMDRWILLTPQQRGPMDSLGADIARGGRDCTVISTRYGGWFDELQSYPGAATPTGQVAAGLIIQNVKDAAPIHVDVIGVGTSAYDHLNENGLQVLGINVANASEYRDRTGKLKMRNKRAELYWALRDALDPVTDAFIALPSDPELKADLCAARWTLTPSGVLVESKQDLVKRIGRSPDKGDAVLLANISTVKESYYDELEEPDYSDMDKDAVGGY